LTKDTKRLGLESCRQQAEQYFETCREKGRHPSLPGLALALGLESRRELERLSAGSGKTAAVLRRAMTRVEEANVQSAYKKDLSGVAKFILQNGFGYSEKAGTAQAEEIAVSIVEDRP